MWLILTMLWLYFSYTLLDDVMPKILAKGRRGEVAGRWLERAVFAVSTGGVVTVSCFTHCALHSGREDPG